MKSRIFKMTALAAVFLAAVIPFAACGENEDEPAGNTYDGPTYTVACLGDSITLGVGASANNKRYTSLLGDEEWVSSLQNVGFSGSFVGLNGNNNYMDMYSFLNRYTEIYEGTDFIFVFGGTNDYGSDLGCVPVGEKGDTTGYTFYGALSILMDGLKTSYSDATLLFATPLQRDDEWAGSPSTTPYNEYGNTLEEYRDAIVDMCEENSIECLDLYNLEGMRSTDSTFKDYLDDGLHPNDAGHKLVANAVSAKIKDMLNITV